MDNLQPAESSKPVEKATWMGCEDLPGVGVALLSGEPLLLRPILEKEQMKFTDIPFEKIKILEGWIDHAVIHFLVGEEAYRDREKWEKLPGFTRWTVQNLRSFAGAIIDPFIAIAWLFKVAGGDSNKSWWDSFQDTFSTQEGWINLGKEIAKGTFELGCSMIGTGIGYGLLVGMSHVTSLLLIVALMTAVAFLGMSYYQATDSIDIKEFIGKSKELLSFGISCTAVGMIWGAIATPIVPLLQAKCKSLAFLIPTPNTLAFRGSEDAPWPEYIDKRKFMAASIDQDSEALQELTYRQQQLIEEMKKIKNFSVEKGKSFDHIAANVATKQWLYNRKIQLQEVKKKIKELQNKSE